MRASDERTTISRPRSEARSSSNNDFRYGFMLSGGDRYPAEDRQAGALERSGDGQAHRARAAGRRGRAAGLRRHRRGGRRPDRRRQDRRPRRRVHHRSRCCRRTARFNVESFKSFVRVQLRSTPSQFLEEQKKELLASRLRNLAARQRRRLAGRGEVRLRRAGTARSTSSTCASPAGGYEAEVALTDAEIAAYAGKNEAKLKEIYEQKKYLYEKAPAQRRAPADPRQGAPRRRREDRQGGAREGRRAGGKAQARREEHRQGRA